MLEERTLEVEAAEDPKAEATRLWRTKSAKAWEDVRQKLDAMCSGADRCMYCEDSSGYHIEHFYPKAAYPERAFKWENYLYACPHCNSNEKRDRFPTDPQGSPLLIDPTVDEPFESLDFFPSTGKYRARDNRGEASIEVFGLNRSKLAMKRAPAWLGIQILIEKEGDPIAEGLGLRLQQLGFSGVIVAILRMAQKKDDADPREPKLRPECRRALAARPEIFEWFVPDGPRAPDSSTV